MAAADDAEQWPLRRGLRFELRQRIRTPSTDHRGSRAPRSRARARRAQPEHANHDVDRVSAGDRMYTRREFGQLTLGGLALPLLSGAQPSKVGGVQLGVQTYSFRALPRPADGDHVDVVIDAMKQCGVSECELFAPQVEPRQTS